MTPWESRRLAGKLLRLMPFFRSAVCRRGRRGSQDRTPAPRWRIVPAAILLIPFCPLDANAMHIAEGLLPLHWAVLWFLTAIPFLAWGLHDLKKRSRRIPLFKPLAGLVGAAVFVISCMPIPVPVAGTCSHPSGAGMAAILIGPGLTAVIASVALLLQALFLAHGGLSTLGANIISMGVVGGLTGYATFWLMRRLRASLALAAFLAGMISDWATYAATSFQLASALHGAGPFARMFATIALAFCPTQVPLGILEGFLTAGALAFIHARRPEFFNFLSRSARGAA
jgi:cobalt/nickel transport system permease protein